MGTKYVYDFHEGNRDMKALLGGKGANLAEMTNMGLHVPPAAATSAAAITTRPCAAAAARESTTATVRSAISAARTAFRYITVNSMAGVMTTTDAASAASMAERYSTVAGALDFTGSPASSAP